MPDIFVPIDTAAYPDAISRLLVDGRFNNFVYRYYLQHKQQMETYNSAEDYNHRFSYTDDMWNQFVQFGLKDLIDLNSVSAKQKQSLQERLKAYLARFRWRNYGFYEVLNNDDPVVLKALEELRSKVAAIEIKLMQRHCEATILTLSKKNSAVAERRHCERSEAKKSTRQLTDA